MRGHALKTLNLDDNLISAFSELQALAALTSLRELTLRSKLTDNPICRNPKYISAVSGLAGQIEVLDGAAVLKKIERVPVKENKEPNEGNRDVQEELKQILKGVKMGMTSRRRTR